MPGKMSDPGTVPEKTMKFGADVAEDEESGHDVGKDNEIRASSEEGSGQAPERLDPGEYRKR